MLLKDWNELSSLSFTYHSLIIFINSSQTNCTYIRHQPSIEFIISIHHRIRSENKIKTHTKRYCRSRFSTQKLSIFKCILITTPDQKPEPFDASTNQISFDIQKNYPKNSNVYKPKRKIVYIN